MKYKPEGIPEGEWPSRQYNDFKIKTQLEPLDGFQSGPGTSQWYEGFIWTNEDQARYEESQDTPAPELTTFAAPSHWLICATCGNDIRPCSILECDHESDHIERKTKPVGGGLVAEMLRNCELCAHDLLVAALGRKLGRV